MWKFIAFIVFARFATSAAQTPAASRCAPVLGFLTNLKLLGVTDRSADFGWDLKAPRSNPIDEVRFTLELRDREGNRKRSRYIPTSDNFVYTLDGLSPNSWYMVKVQAMNTKGGRCEMSSNIIWTSFTTLLEGTRLLSSLFAPLLAEKMNQRHRRGSQLLFFAEKRENEIVLDHDFRISTIGVVNYYEILVSRMPMKTDMLELVNIPRLIGDIHKIRMKNEEQSTRADTRDQFSETLRKALFGDWRPQIPMEIVIIRITQNAIRLAIVFPPPSIPTDGWDAPRMRLKPGLADPFNFPRFEEFLFRIRRCVSYHWSDFDCCGRASDFSLLANVGGPSVVRYPELLLICGILHVFWKEPAQPRGPLDGYVVSIQTTVEGRNETQVVHMNSSETHHEIPNYSREQAYNIGIAAFNFDLENATVEHTGEFVFILPPDSWWFHYGQTLSMIVIILAIAVLGVFTTCLCWETISRCRRYRRGLPPIIHQD